MSFFLFVMIRRPPISPRSSALFPATPLFRSVADIGIEATSDLRLIERPRLRLPGADDHKYTRGYVALLAGEMPGAIALAASAAVRRAPVTSRSEEHTLNSSH